MKPLWAAVREDGKVRFLDAPDPVADFALVAEQAAALPGARLIYQGATAEQLEAANAHRDAMIAEGRMHLHISPAKPPSSVMRMLRQLHDRIARETA